MQSRSQSRTSVASINNFRVWLAGAAICLLLALLIAPSTGGLVRLQIKQVLGTGPDIFDAKVASASIAASHPDDFQIQLAAAAKSYFSDYFTGHGNLQIAPLVELETRFANRPSTYANILRILSIQSPSYGRAEDYLVFGEQPPKTGIHPLQSEPPFPYAFYDQTVMAGERMDPNNAYFPLMRACALYRQHKDAAAMAEVHKASLKPYWRECYADDAYGAWKISGIQLGTRTALMLMASRAAIANPHYSGLREVARVELYKAILAEQSGDVKRGLAIREDLMRCGSLMRAQSGTLSCSLAGIAIIHMGIFRPDGKNIHITNTHINGYVAENMILAQFLSYLQRNGRSDLIQPVSAEYSAGELIIRSGLTKPLDDDSDIIRTIDLWIADCIVLSNVFMLLALGVIASVFVRLFHLDVPLTVSKGSRWKKLGQNLVIVLSAGLGVFLFVQACNWQIGRCLGLSMGWVPASMPLKISVFAGPLLVCTISLVVSLVRKVPVVNGMLLGLMRIAIPAACVLVLVYGAVFIKTMTQEHAVISHIQEQLVSEGQYCARVSGHPWPGPTKWPAQPARNEQAGGGGAFP